MDPPHEHPQADGSEKLPAAGLPLVPAADLHLLDGCLAGDPAAWDAFVDRFCGLLAFVVDRTAAQRHTGITPSERDDLLADILLALVHHDAALLREFDRRSSLATYLTVVSRRLVIPALRHLSSKAGAPERPHGDGVRDGPPARPRAPAVSEKTASSRDDPDAMLVRLHDVEGRSYGEISRITGMPLGAIGPALTAARRHLRRGDG